jgi:hypothetical protein
MKKPISDKQLAANRANAAQSTGPRSPEGKSRSAQNARKHGFTASTFAVVRLEEIDEVARLREDAIAVYQPVNSQELFAIERIALAQQALLRVERLHTGLCTTFLNEALDGNGRPLMGICDALVNDDNEITKAQNRNYLFAEGFHRLNKYSNSFTLFLRYQAQTERLYRRAIEEFDRLKALRHELPNEPVMDTQPEENETVGTTPAGNIPRKPGTATLFPAHFAGIRVTVPGFAPRDTLPDPAPGRKMSPPPTLGMRSLRGAAFQAAMPPFVGASFLSGFPPHSTTTSSWHELCVEPHLSNPNEPGNAGNAADCGSSPVVL